LNVERWMLNVERFLSYFAMPASFFAAVSRQSVARLVQKIL